MLLIMLLLGYIEKNLIYIINNIYNKNIINKKGEGMKTKKIILLFFLFIYNDTKNENYTNILTSTGFCTLVLWVSWNLGVRKNKENLLSRSEAAIKPIWILCCAAGCMGLLGYNLGLEELPN